MLETIIVVIAIWAAAAYIVSMSGKVTRGTKSIANLFGGQFY